MAPTTPTPRKPSRRFDSPQQEVFLELWRTYDRLKAVEDELFAAHGLTAQQYNALRVLQAARPAAVPTLTLGGRLISRAPDMTRLLDKLEDRGLIERRRPHDDRRTVLVAISDAGVRLLDDLAEEVRRCHVRQVGHLTAAQMRSLIRLLTRARAPHEPPERHRA